MAELLRGTQSMLERIRVFMRLAARVLGAQSQQEREKRLTHAFALLLVFAVASVKYVTGLTVDGAPFTLYAVAIAGSAARGGFAPGLVAALASLLVAGFGSLSGSGPLPRVLFLTEGVGVALIVSAIRSRLWWTDARLRAAQGTIAGLKLRDRHGRMLDAALRHLEETSDERAVVVLNDLGLISAWRGGAERLYGYSGDHLVGESAAGLFFEAPSPGEWSALLHEAAESGLVQRPDVHRRRDGSRIEVEIEIKPFRDRDAGGFTLTVHDLARRREWSEYRQAAVNAQAALQQAADDTRQQLAALESLTDPSLNPLGGAAMVTELLERLRAAVHADGVALVRPGRVGAGVMAARGLQPLAGPTSTESLRLTPGRVAVVHNDPARVEQLSAVRWTPGVASLLVVPVVHDGRVWSTIEVVSERSRQVSDWDVALVRVVADRLSAVVVQDRGLAA